MTIAVALVALVAVTIVWLIAAVVLGGRELRLRRKAADARPPLSEDEADAQYAAVLRARESARDQTAGRLKVLIAAVSIAVLAIIISAGTEPAVSFLRDTVPGLESGQSLEPFTRAILVGGLILSVVGILWAFLAAPVVEYVSDWRRAGLTADEERAAGDRHDASVKK